MKSSFLSKNQKNIIGIFGGVGPLAHVEFEKKLLDENFQRGAGHDQDHPVWMLINASSTPDRTTHLLKDSTVPVEYMVHYAQLLERMGSDALFVICNTAHGYHQAVQKQLSIPWVHLMEITAAYISSKHKNIQKVGILATDGTLSLRLYHDALKTYQLQPIAPTIGTSIQKDVMDAIYDKDFGIKATGSHIEPTALKNLIVAAQWCMEEGADAIIAGCTEISVALTPHTFPFVPIIDPLEIAAQTALDIASGKKSPHDFMIK